MICPGPYTNSCQLCLDCMACAPRMSPAIQQFLEKRFFEDQITFSSLVSRVEGCCDT